MKWNVSISIAQFFKEGAVDDDACVIGKEIANHVKKRLDTYLQRLGEDASNMYEALQRLESINTVKDWQELKKSSPIWDRMPPLKELDENLDNFYDEADNLGIWVNPNKEHHEGH
ncbi:hypothetical protein [Alteromonas sp. 14N.309.X.WAT.G.H12]|uniref:hypothetical protein n=1 Tax=Alteromonas sp. 14N.309.X.WAT.G.H12 TaxID=3120824 RepID=UPI002FD64179